jgi:Predicted glycosyltransferases
LPVGVVVVNYASSQLIARNFAGLSGRRVVVVDNYSGDAERDACTRLCAAQGWQLVTGPNVGYGEGFNAGLAELDECEVVVVANPDLGLAADQLDVLAQAALAHPADLVAPSIIGPSGRSWGGLGTISLAEGRLYTKEAADGPRWLSGACLAATTELWHRLDGFAPGYFMYWEDVDLSYRVQELGGQCRVLPEPRVRHDVGGTQGGKAALYYFYNARNRLVFAARNRPAAERWLWLRGSVGELRRIVSRGAEPGRWRKLTRAAWPALLGTVAGARILLAGRRSTR